MGVGADGVGSWADAVDRRCQTVQFRMSFRRVSCEPPMRPAPCQRVPHSACRALQRIPPALEPNCQPCETVRAQRQLMEQGSPMRLSEFTRSSHTRLPRRHMLDCALPRARRANRQPPPFSAVPCRSFPHACALNCRLPLARLPTSANCPCASLQSVSFRAGPPYNYLLTLAQLPSPIKLLYG